MYVNPEVKWKSSVAFETIQDEKNIQMALGYFGSLCLMSHRDTTQKGLFYAVKSTSSL